MDKYHSKHQIHAKTFLSPVAVADKGIKSSTETVGSRFCREQINSKYLLCKKHCIFIRQNARKKKNYTIYTPTHGGYYAMV